MERRKLSSGHLKSAGYDEKNRLLEIEFANGTIIQYSGVSPEVYRRLVNSPSPTSYFRDHIEEEYTGRQIK